MGVKLIGKQDAVGLSLVLELPTALGSCSSRQVLEKGLGQVLCRVCWV